MLKPGALRQPRQVGWMGGGREVHEGGDICIPGLIHVDVWQKPT